MGHSLHVNNLFGESFQSKYDTFTTLKYHNTLTNFNSPASSFKFYLSEFFKFQNTLSLSLSLSLSPADGLSTPLEIKLLQ